MSVSQYTVSAAVCCAAHTRRTSKAAGSSCEVDKEMWRAFVVRKKTTAICKQVSPRPCCGRGVIPTSV